MQTKEFNPVQLAGAKTLLANLPELNGLATVEEAAEVLHRTIRGIHLACNEFGLRPRHSVVKPWEELEAHAVSAWRHLDVDLSRVIWQKPLWEALRVMSEAFAAEQD